MDKVKERIETIIQEEVALYTQYIRQPIVGYASAQDPLYAEMSQRIGNPQLLPTDLLKEAKTVIVFFLPHSLQVIQALRAGKNIVQAWSDNYLMLNDLLDHIAKTLQVKLRDEFGVMSAMEPPTNNYNDIELTAKWPHKTSAVIAGIGTFGLNRLLITKSGCAGRLNSLIIDKQLEPSVRPKSSYCLYYKAGKCSFCAQHCPSGAITKMGWNRFRCNAYLDGKNVRDTEQGCGICSSGPCADRGF
ncbi:hypothetical protein [Megasphaera sp.]|uniref:hypothetical protein n=1 Tax=Megasphaera sp. TaxID=2023260 RepID=UPI0025BBDA05|nr:hypothetical protein [Megasphaera sp.]MCF0152936.1 epoxyqueuosine reductase [Megasphaera sp.]